VGETALSVSQATCRQVPDLKQLCIAFGDLSQAVYKAIALELILIKTKIGVLDYMPAPDGVSPHAFSG
jgi:hypothetical protein